MSNSILCGGIKLEVYRNPSNEPKKEAIILFFLHGRFGNKSDANCKRVIETILSTNNSQSNERELIIVSFDQRNHGERLVNINKNRGFKDNFNFLPKLARGEGELDNESHAVDMYNIQLGTTQDVSFLIDTLPAVLFPNDEQTVVDWWISGISLGGHVAWLAVALEKRISLSIPIIGSSDFLTLMSKRAATLPPPLGPLPITAPYFPKSLLALIAKFDPVQQPLGNFQGKKIYCLSGELDELVPFTVSGTEEFVEKLKKNGVSVDFSIESGVGHACTQVMATKAAEYIKAALAEKEKVVAKM